MGDKNRYLDTIFHYEDSSGAKRLRVLILEDATKAVNIPRPMSFDVRVLHLNINGIPSSSEFLGKHLTPLDVGGRLDFEELPWINSTLVNTMVQAVTSWPWKCSVRQHEQDTSLSSGDFLTQLTGDI